MGFSGFSGIERGTLRITRRDNGTIVLTGPTMLNDSIIGSTEAEPHQRVAIALFDVIFVQARKRSFDKTMDGVMNTTQVVMGIIFLTTTILIIRIL